MPRQTALHSVARAAAAAALILGLARTAAAEEPLAHGWVLDPDASQLRVTSVKKSTIAETSTFATFAGEIDETGAAEIRVLTDSIDTTIDLRNVRMRFLLFETFKFPEATITMRIDPAALADLRELRRKTMDLTYSITLHGITAERTDKVLVTLLDNDTVAVSTSGPIYLKLADFDLEAGRQKLQEAANVDIVPLGTVTFDFLFRRKRPGGAVPITPVAAAATPAAAAIESKGDLDAEACIGRFEILSRTGNIYFGSGSARLRDSSLPLLQTLLDVVRRCPEMRVQVAGHTDADGPDAANQSLSEARARAVADWLTANGIEAARVKAVGFGETRPAFPNDTAAHKERNRRIEFSVITG